MPKKVFVLGDSRTGTTSLHKLFLDQGMKSIHYYVDEVAEIARKHGAEKPEYTHAREFFEESGFDAFSDYPTRIYYKELIRDYPDAFFILSIRGDIPTWKKLMRRFFPDRRDVLENLKHLTQVHIKTNNQIRRLYASAEHFIEICIDDGNEVNNTKLAEFFGLYEVNLKRLNARQ